MSQISSGNQVEKFDLQDASEDDWGAVVPSFHEKAPSQHHVKTSSSWCREPPQSEDHNNVCLPSALGLSQDGDPNASLLTSRSDEAAHTCPMNGAWQSLGPSNKLTADFAFFVIDGHMLLTALGKTFTMAEGSTKGTVLLQDSVISLGSSGLLKLTSSSGQTARCQRVAVRKPSTLFGIQGCWEQWDNSLRSKRMLIMQGLVWQLTINHCTSSGVLGFNNGAVTLEGSVITLSARGKLQVKHESTKVWRFTRQANPSKLSAILE